VSRVCAWGAGVGLASALAVAGAANSCVDVPTTYRVRASGNAAARNVLFVGDGFAAGQLDVYRAVTAQLAEGLGRDETYAHYPDAFAFYRLDVTDPGGTVTRVNCPPSVDVSPVTDLAFATPPPAAVEIAGSGDPVEDLGLALCWVDPEEPPGTGGSYRTLWLDPAAQWRLLEWAAQISAVGPRIDIVAVVGNTERRAGGGRSMVYGSGIGLVTFGVPNEASAGAGTYEVSTTGLWLFSHELSHALGLLDEYVEDAPRKADAFEGDRNVWHPCQAGSGRPPEYCPAPPWTQGAAPVPWSPVMFPPCTPESMVKVCASLAEAGPCKLEDTAAPYQQASCYYVPWECTAESGPDRTCDPPLPCCFCPGAWEGAYYHKHGYYRSALHCRMNKLPHPFCAACRRLIDEKLCTTPPCPWKPPPCYLPRNPLFFPERPPP